MTTLLDMLTSGVHDAKNQLFVAESLIVQAEAEHGVSLAEARYAIELAAARLARVLTAYRMQRQVGGLAIEMVALEELIAEAGVINAAHCRHLGLALEQASEPGLWWALDREMVLDALSNAIQNAARFACRCVRISAARDAGMLSIKVEDDGPGFADTPVFVPCPADDATDAPINDLALPQGGIGLFVARELARLHVRDDAQGQLRGELRLYNGGAFGGAVFELRLP